MDLDAQTSISGSRSDTDILAEVSGSNVISSDEDSDTEESNGNDIPIKKLSGSDAVAALNTLEDISIFMNFGSDMLQGLKFINRAMELESITKKKQANIQDFFGRT